MMVAIMTLDHWINVIIRQKFNTVNFFKLFPIERIDTKWFHAIFMILNLIISNILEINSIVRILAKIFPKSTKNIFQNAK